jgi:hypothetical protein
VYSLRDMAKWILEGLVYEIRVPLIEFALAGVKISSAEVQIADGYGFSSP